MIKYTMYWFSNSYFLDTHFNWLYVGNSNQSSHHHFV